MHAHLLQKVMRRLQDDARHRVELLDRDQIEVESMLSELENRLDAAR